MISTSIFSTISPDSSVCCLHQKPPTSYSAPRSSAGDGTPGPSFKSAERLRLSWHHHFQVPSYHTKFNDLWTDLLESTGEQPRPQMTKQIDPHKRKPAQKYFHPVRWSKAFPIGYHQRGITLITFEMNELGNMTAGASHKKTEQLD